MVDYPFPSFPELTFYLKLAYSHEETNLPQARDGLVKGKFSSPSQLDLPANGK